MKSTHLLFSAAALMLGGRSYGSDTREVPTDARLTDTAMLRDGRYKYFRTLVRGETEEIYDLDSDPEELNNLAARPEADEGDAGEWRR